MDRDITTQLDQIKSLCSGLFCCRHAIAQQPGNGSRIVGLCPRQPPEEVCHGVVPLRGKPIVLGNGGYLDDLAVVWAPRLGRIDPLNPAIILIPMGHCPLIKCIKVAPHL